MHDTPLRNQHKELGGRLVEFAGWNMPVVYTSIVEEHTAVRERVGLFDLSHMGRLDLSGDNSASSLDSLIPADLSQLSRGQAKYTFLLTDDGGFIDDILVYVCEDRYFAVVNASNREAVLAWLAERYEGQVDDRTFEMGMLAVQGPRAVPLIEGLADGTPSELDYYSFGDYRLFDSTVMVARTGYTGEDGFEIYIPADLMPTFWAGILEAGQADGILPCGLGARDTLRLEAAMALYGHEIGPENNPVEARLSWAVAWDKQATFVGDEAIRKVKEDGPTRRLVGLVLDSKRVPREGQAIYHGEEQVGTVTSGTVSPTLAKRIAMGYVRRGLTKPGTALEVDIRGHHEPAEVVKLPFYRRQK